MILKIESGMIAINMNNVISISIEEDKLIIRTLHQDFEYKLNDVSIFEDLVSKWQGGGCSLYKIN